MSLASILVAAFRTLLLTLCSASFGLFSFAGPVLSQSIAEVQARADQQTTDIISRNELKIGSYYLEDAILSSNVTRRQGDYLTGPREIAKHWSMLGVRALKIEVYEARLIEQTEGLKGFVIERSLFTMDLPDRQTVKGERVALWRPTAGGWQLVEDFWTDMELCKKLEDGTITCAGSSMTP